MNCSNTTLVLGGARSGKSAFAERLVADAAGTRLYLATAIVGDDEMRERIAHHRARRSDGWRTIEEPLALVETLSREGRASNAIMVDCLTLWLSNLMHSGKDVDGESRRLSAYLRETRAKKIVLVSNEVGLGLVPDTPLGRAFRDAQGRLNQAVAAAVNNVVFIAAGLPIWLKQQS